MINQIKQAVTVVAILFPILGFAQKEITITESEMAMSKGNKNGFTTTVWQNKFKEVEKNWQKYLKEGNKAKVDLIAGEYISIGLVNKGVSPFPFNVYSKLTEVQDGVQMIVFFADDDKGFYSTAAVQDRAAGAQNFLRTFVVNEYKAAVKNELDQETKKAKKLDEQLKDLIKEEDRANKKVIEYKAGIINEQANADNAKNSLSNQSLDVKSQKDIVKAEEKAQNRIKEYNEGIFKEQKVADKAHSDQQAKNTEIAVQHDVVNTVQNKLQNIK